VLLFVQVIDGANDGVCIVLDFAMVAGFRFVGEMAMVLPLYGGF